MGPEVDVIKMFGGNSGKSRFPPQLKQQEQAILNSINSFRVQFCLKIALFSQFTAVSDIKPNFFISQFWGNLDFLKKKFYSINYCYKISLPFMNSGGLPNLLLFSLSSSCYSFPFSVTGWLDDYFFNIWPFTTMKTCPIA